MIAWANVRPPFRLWHSPTLFLSVPLFISRTFCIHVLVGNGNPAQVLWSDPSPNSKLTKIHPKFSCYLDLYWVIENADFSNLSYKFKIGCYFGSIPYWCVSYPYLLWDDILLILDEVEFQLLVSCLGFTYDGKIYSIYE